MAQDTSIEYLEALENEISAEPFTETLRDDLKQMLTGKALRLAHKYVIVEGVNMAAQMAQADLSDPKGVHGATRLQGKIEGLQRALDIIFECSLPPYDEGEQDGEGS